MTGFFRYPATTPKELWEDRGEVTPCRNDTFLPLDLYGSLPYRGCMANLPTVARLEARLPAETYAMLKRAAEIEGRTLSDFVVSAAREAASRTIEQAQVLRLSAKDQRLFAETILNPPAPNAALKRMAKRHRELFGA